MLGRMALRMNMAIKIKIEMKVGVSFYHVAANRRMDRRKAH